VIIVCECRYETDLAMWLREPSHISGHKIKVNFLFVSSSDSDIHDINNTAQLTFDLM